MTEKICQSCGKLNMAHYHCKELFGILYDYFDNNPKNLLEIMYFMFNNYQREFLDSYQTIKKQRIDNMSDVEKYLQGLLEETEGAAPHE